MGLLSLHKISCFLTAYLITSAAGLALPLNHALRSSDSLDTVFSNVSNPNMVEMCTSSLMWIGGTSYDYIFTDNCYQAWKTFLATDMVTHMSTEFEFLQQGVTPSFPGIPKMATPRRYVKGESTIHPECMITSLTRRCPDSCTLAIVNIVDVPNGILPVEPPGPFPRSDLGRFSEIRKPMIAVRAGCLGRRKEAGWAIAGMYISNGLLGQVLFFDGN